MAKILCPRSVSGKSIIDLIKRPLLESASYQQTTRPIHSGDGRGAIADLVLSNETSGIKSYEEIPGPKPLPIIGNCLRFIPFIGEYHGMDVQEFTSKMHQQFGNICRLTGIPGRKDMLIIHRPEDVEMTFRNEGTCPIREGLKAPRYYRNYINGEFYQNGLGIVFENGSKWLDERRKANPAMMQPKIERRYTQPISEVAQEFIDRIQILKDDKEEMPVDFVNELYKWALESIAFVALDHRLECLASNLSQDSKPQKMIDAVLTLFGCLFHLEMGLRLWRLFPTSQWKKFVKACDYLIVITMKYVEEGIKRVDHRKKKGIEDKDPSVLEMLLARMDPKSACIMAQDMLIVGVDTVAYTAAMVIYELSKNQDKQEMLYKELKRLLPSKEDSITENKLEDMKYLKACLKESRRIRPIVPGNLRTTVKETVLSNYRVPPGVLVFMPTVISRNLEEYFPMSEKYIPERWLKTRPTGQESGSVEDFDTVSKRKGNNPFALLPFGFGPRTCVGKRIADLQLEILIAKMVRKFQIEYNYGEMRFLNRFLLTPKDPLRFKLIERHE